MIRFKVTEPRPVKLAVADAVVIETGGVSPYLGAYDVTPAVRERQILPTQGKRMERDVTVHAIPYAEVSNAAGGKTITIGG